MAAKKKYVFIGHYGCAKADRVVCCKLPNVKTLRPNWLEKWRVPECPACGEEHEVVHPMWRKSTEHERRSKAEITLRPEHLHNKVKVRKIKPGEKIGAYLNH